MLWTILFILCLDALLARLMDSGSSAPIPSADPELRQPFGRRVAKAFPARGGVVRVCCLPRPTANDRAANRDPPPVDDRLLTFGPEVLAVAPSSSPATIESGRRESVQRVPSCALPRLQHHRCPLFALFEILASRP